jgi:hypothetical protein
MADRRDRQQAGVGAVAEKEEEHGGLAREARLELSRRGLSLRALVTAAGGG